MHRSKSPCSRQKIPAPTLVRDIKTVITVTKVCQSTSALPWQHATLHPAVASLETIFADRQKQKLLNTNVLLRNTERVIIHNHTITLPVITEKRRMASL